MKTLLILCSYHHNNTDKIANALAQVLDAKMLKPEQANPNELQDYSLIGFGSGIYFKKHHQMLLDFADKLPQVTNINTFLFSTSGAPFGGARSHSVLKKKLLAKGYTIVDEFNCPGFDTYGILKRIGGLNRGRPNDKDLKRAEKFAENLKQNLETVS